MVGQQEKKRFAIQIITIILRSTETFMMDAYTQKAQVQIGVQLYCISFELILSITPWRATSERIPSRPLIPTKLE